MKKNILLLLALCGSQSHAYKTYQEPEPAPVPVSAPVPVVAALVPGPVPVVAASVPVGGGASSDESGDEERKQQKLLDALQQLESAYKKIQKKNIRIKKNKNTIIAQNNKIEEMQQRLNEMMNEANQAERRLKHSKGVNPYAPAADSLEVNEEWEPLNDIQQENPNMERALEDVKRALEFGKEGLKDVEQVRNKERLPLNTLNLMDKENKRIEEALPSLNDTQQENPNLERGRNQWQQLAAPVKESVDREAQAQAVGRRNNSNSLGFVPKESDNVRESLVQEPDVELKSVEQAKLRMEKKLKALKKEKDKKFLSSDERKLIDADIVNIQQSLEFLERGRNQWQQLAAPVKESVDREVLKRALDDEVKNQKKKRKTEAEKLTESLAEEMKLKPTDDADLGKRRLREKGVQKRG